MTTPEPDPGLQLERTALAWRRTALALMIGPVAAARLLAPERGVWAALAAAGGLVVAVGVAVLASRRHRTQARVMSGAASPHDLPGGLLLVLTAVVLVAGGVVAGGFVSRL